MPFVPRLPTFNQKVRIFRMTPLTTWVPDVLQVDCQLYVGTRTVHYVWVYEYLSRGQPGFYDVQTGQYHIYILFPKEVVVRGPVEVRAATGFTEGARDFLEYVNPNMGTRTYWIDQVEPRWAGFPNEHKMAMCCQRGFDA